MAVAAGRALPYAVVAVGEAALLLPRRAPQPAPCALCMLLGLAEAGLVLVVGRDDIELGVAMLEQGLVEQGAVEPHVGQQSVVPVFLS